MSKILKKILPRSLFHRFLLIILLPNILVQLISVYMFYERHWSGVSRHMAMSIVGEVDVIMQGIRQNNLHHFIELINDSSLDLHVGIIPNQRIHPSNLDNKYNFRYLLQGLQENLTEEEYSVRQQYNYATIIIQVQHEKDVIEIRVPRRRIFTPTTYIFILWMTCTAIIFVIIAILFMRTQVRSISNLAKAAEQFGKGNDTPNFKPSGATEVRLVSKAFIDMKDRINRHVEQRTEMLAGVSHDLKTPLTRIKLQLAMIPQADGIKELQQDIFEMERMIQEYLDFAKGKERVTDTNVNVTDILRSIVAGYREDGERIEINAEQGITLNVNANALRRAVTNITDNSLKYGNKVCINSRSSKKYAYITIDDDGPGIPKSKRKEVFRPFYRIDNSRNLDKGGSGLGLAIVNDIIVGYGGNITLDKSPQGGLRVVLKIPL